MDYLTVFDFGLCEVTKYLSPGREGWTVRTIVWFFDGTRMESPEDTGAHEWAADREWED